MTFRDYINQLDRDDMANGLQDKTHGAQSLSFDDIPPVPKSYENFRMHQRGDKARASLVFENNEEMFLGAKVHYHSSTGYFNCTGGICCQICTKSRWRVSAPLLIYSKDRESGSLYRWTFSQLTYTQLRDMHQTFPLGRHDFGLLCEHPDYQRYNIAPASKCLWRKWPHADSILAEAKEIVSQTRLAVDLSDTEIQTRLGSPIPSNSPVVNPPKSFQPKSFPPQEKKKKERPSFRIETPHRRIQWT